MKELYEILQNYRNQRKNEKELRKMYLDSLSHQDKVIADLDIKIKRTEEALKKIKKEV